MPLLFIILRQQISRISYIYFIFPPPWVRNLHLRAINSPVLFLPLIKLWHSGVCWSSLGGMFWSRGHRHQRLSHFWRRGGLSSSGSVGLRAAICSWGKDQAEVRKTSQWKESALRNRAAGLLSEYTCLESADNHMSKNLKWNYLFEPPSCSSKAASLWYESADVMDSCQRWFYMIDLHPFKGECDTWKNITHQWWAVPCRRPCMQLETHHRVRKSTWREKGLTSHIHVSFGYFFCCVLLGVIYSNLSSEFTDEPSK